MWGARRGIIPQRSTAEGAAGAVDPADVPAPDPDLGVEAEVAAGAAMPT